MRKLGRIRKKQTIFCYAMLAWPIIHVLIFWIYVNTDAILMAFQNVDYTKGGEVYWTLDNFKQVYRMFAEKGAGLDMIRCAKNTFIYWLLGTVWTIPHSVVLTYVFHRKLRGMKFFRIMLIVPGMMNSVALAGIYMAIIDGSGAVGQLLYNVFNVARVPAWFQEAEYVLPAVLFYSFFFGFAGQYILYSGALNNIGSEVFEAAAMDGITMWQEILYICVPGMWPTISMTIVSGFAGIFGASGPLLLLAPKMTEAWSMGYWIFDQVRQYQSYYIPATLGLCFTVIAFPISLLIKNKVNNMFTIE